MVDFTLCVSLVEEPFRSSCLESMFFVLVFFGPTLKRCGTHAANFPDILCFLVSEDDSTCGLGELFPVCKVSGGVVVSDDLRQDRGCGINF